MHIHESPFFSIKLTLLFALILGSSRVGAEQQLKMPNIFGDKMVLQRDKPIRIWGWAGAESPVTVSFAGKSETVIPDSKGKWEVALAAMSAQSSGQALTVRRKEEALVFKDVLVGDVWLCGGQSNMEWRLRSSRDADLEIPSSNYPALRFLRIRPEGSAGPREN
ncbi:MAG TPA: sialate O-acetylesterase, partial [Verrucomicrobiales bacterium]|nr:sialate O-acetylesterase [Verrucomicrobiales bacterium]